MVKNIWESFSNGFKEFGHDVASVVNFLLLLIVYIVGVGPVSVISKILRKRFLDLKFKQKRSLWVERKPIQNIDEYYRPF